MILPTLYKKTNAGAIQRWDVFVDGATIRIGHGQVDGAIQRGDETITEGKNLGKKNATTPAQQAEAEAKAKWLKVKKKGYVESIEAAQAGSVDEDIILGGILPMLAPSKIYPHFAKHLNFPVYVQPKLDGVRCIAILKDGKCTLWSRTRKRINSVPHIVAAVERYFGGRGDLTLDGELYSHELKDDFEELISIIRKDEPALGHEKIEYHVYDLPSWPATFALRSRELRGRFHADGALLPLILVDTQTAPDDAAIKFEHEVNLGVGYEGSMIRNDGPYEGGKRSMHLQKLKIEIDDEFKIIGAEEGRGKDAGTVGAFVLVTKDGKEFRARLKATYARRGELFRRPELWTGKRMTITYQNLTSDGIPRFPRGKAIRDYE